MSIASEITRISAARNDILTSISNKGVEVPATATLSSCPALIDSIQTGGGSIPSNEFKNPAFILTASTTAGSYVFTATQIETYEGESNTAITNITEWNDGNWSHGGDIGFAIDSNLSAVIDDVKYSSASIIISANGYWRDQENIRYSYNSANIPDNNFCGSWYYNRDNNTYKLVFTGFGGSKVVPTGYPVYISLPYTNRSNAITSVPATASGFVITATALPYPQYSQTTTGTWNLTASGNQQWDSDSYYGQYAPARMVYTKELTINVTYDDGPADSGMTTSYSSATSDIYNNTGRLQTYLTSLSDDTKKLCLDTNYSYVTGNG